MPLDALMPNCIVVLNCYAVLAFKATWRYWLMIWPYNLYFGFSPNCLFDNGDRQKLWASHEAFLRF